MLGYGFASEFKFTRLLRRITGNSGKGIITNVSQDSVSQDFIVDEGLNWDDQFSKEKGKISGGLKSLKKTEKSYFTIPA